MKIEINFMFKIQCSLCPNYIIHSEGGDAEHYSAFEMNEIIETAEKQFDSAGWTFSAKNGDIEFWRCPEHPVK